MANTDIQQGYGGGDGDRLLEDEPTPPAVEDDWGVDGADLDDSLQEASSPAQE